MIIFFNVTLGLYSTYSKGQLSLSPNDIILGIISKYLPIYRIKSNKLLSH